MAAKKFESEPHPFGPAVSQLIEQFATLPGIGRKSAERLTNYILGCGTEAAEQLAEAILEVKRSVRACSICFNLTQNEHCAICEDSRRDQDVLCVVEQPRDVTILEASGAYQGLYHILQGRLSPLEGVNPEDLTLDALVTRVREKKIREIVMATNPTYEGDATALLISNLLEGQDVKISKLARGIATGSVLEFANKEMLADALRGRQDF